MVMIASYGPQKEGYLFRTLWIILWVETKSVELAEANVLLGAVRGAALKAAGGLSQRPIEQSAFFGIASSEDKIVAEMVRV